MKTRTAKGIQLAKTLSISLLLMGLAITGGISLGRLIDSPNWMNAVRLAGIGGVIAIILANPITGMLLWIILEPYQRFWYLNISMPRGIPDLSLSRFAIAFLCIIWLANLATGKKRLRHVGGIEICIVMFSIMTLPAIAAGLEGFRGSIQILFDTLLVPFLVLVLAKNFYEGKETLDKLIIALIVIVLYLCFMIFYEHVTGQPLFYVLGRATVYTKHLRKIVSLLGNPAYHATVLAMIVPMTLYKFVRVSSNSARALYGFLSVLAMLGNFFCYNRGGWLALFMAILVLLLFEREYRRILLPFVLMMVVLLLAFWRQFTETPTFSERLANVTSVQFRLYMLKVSMKIIREHLLLGVGFDNFAYYYKQYGGYWSSYAPTPPTPHNTYIRILVTMGLAGLIPYVLLFLSTFLEMGSLLRRADRGKGADRALLVSGWAAIIAYMVSAAAVDIYYSTFTSLICFCIAGVVLGHVSHFTPSHKAMTG